jgi:hypothetical protein
MDKYASEKFIERDLQNIRKRIHSQEWTVVQRGLFVKFEIKHEKTGEIFSPFFNCVGYPRHPLSASFLPINPIRYPLSKWPNDKNYMFRTSSPYPFICLPGLLSYIPERGIHTNPYSMSDIHIGTLITRIYQAINSQNYIGYIER